MNASIETTTLPKRLRVARDCRSPFHRLGVGRNRDIQRRSASRTIDIFDKSTTFCTATGDSFDLLQPRCESFERPDSDDPSRQRTILLPRILASFFGSDGQRGAIIINQSQNTVNFFSPTKFCVKPIELSSYEFVRSIHPVPTESVQVKNGLFLSIIGNSHRNSCFRKSAARIGLAADSNDSDYTHDTWRFLSRIAGTFVDKKG